MGTRSTTFHGKGIALADEKDYSGPLVKHQKWDLDTSGQQQLVSKTGREQWDGATLHHRVQLPPSITMHNSAAALQLHNLYVTS